MSSSFSALETAVPAPAVSRSRGSEGKTSNLTYLFRALFSLLGFTVAEIICLTVPDSQEGNDTVYRFILVGLIVVYFGIALFLWFQEDRRVKFIGRAPFRFAMGIVLALWDLLSTKLNILPLPFFPGPSKVTSAFLEDFNFLLTNTYYSLRLFFFGFVAGRKNSLPWCFWKRAESV